MSAARASAAHEHVLFPCAGWPQEDDGDVLVGSVVGRAGRGAVAVTGDRPAWTGKPIGELTAREAVEALAFLQAHRLGDEALAQVLALAVVSRPTAR